MPTTMRPFSRCLHPPLALALVLAGACQPEREDTGPADTGPVDTGFACDVEGQVAISGNAFNFGPEGGWVEGAEIGLLEHDGFSTTTDAEGFYRIEGLPSGERATLVLSHPDHYPYLSGTFELCGEDLEQVSLQAPTWSTVELMATFTQAEPEDGFCQLATTVTMAGGSLYQSEPGSHGEPGATVQLRPAAPEESGPVYFNLISATIIYPDLSLEETSEDGGVLYVNVPEGLYRMKAAKEGMAFSEVLLTCQAGTLANASPPWGINVISGEEGAAVR